ncbi:MAG: type II toxin-antitoxin system YafQ family toxin [Lachnospiraceae bacterium]|nr:type II toxin-antitoxin system YafQ family toxin [Lachnospiraceae bacterium]
MRKTKYTVKTTNQLKKDFKLAMKRGLNIDLLETVIATLALGEPLPDKNKDHALTENWIGHRECHILPDWLLIYRIEEEVLILTLARSGTHSDLFGK